MPTHFKNLAGCEDCDHYIRLELGDAGIGVINCSPNQILEEFREVPWTVLGYLGGNENLIHEFQNKHKDILTTKVSLPYLASFTFKRKWRYWEVIGDVPLEVAEVIYEASQKDKLLIRAGCHCGDLPPDKFKSEVKIAGHYCIDSYHIDTQEGLKVFADLIKSHNLC